MKTLLALLAISSTTFAEDKDAMKALAGTWVVEKFEVEGGDQSDAFKGTQLVLGDGKYSVTVNKVTDSGTFIVSTAKAPHTMDIEGTEGPNKGKKFLCIYELKDGKLTICYSLEEKVRPAKFETAKESKTLLAVYKKK